MLVSFVFLHTEVEFIDEGDVEGGADDPLLVGGGGLAGDKRLLSADDLHGVNGQRALLNKGGGAHFWEQGVEGAEDDKPKWQRALEEQKKRRMEKQAQQAMMWGGRGVQALAQQQGLDGAGCMPLHSLAAASWGACWGPLAAAADGASGGGTAARSDSLPLKAGPGRRRGAGGRD